MLIILTVHHRGAASPAQGSYTRGTPCGSTRPNASLHDQRLLLVPDWVREEGGPSPVIGTRRRAVTSLLRRLLLVPGWD